MNEVIWRDRFNIGVEVIDRAHQRLFSIVGKLLSLNEDTAKQQHACKEGIKYFKSYTLKHFAEEEAYMQSIQYSEYDMHKSLHDNLRDNTLPALERELEEQNYSVESVQHFLGICVGWLNTHIMIEDYAITGRTTNKWVHQTSQDELVSLEKAIRQAFQNLYRARAEVVSRHYGGEDFSSGTALCYRLTYKSKEGRLVQVFLIYEEPMVLRTLSAMLDRPIKKLDKTVLYVLKVLSQRFMDCIGSHFTLTSSCELQKDDMMTFEQLVRAFEQEYPPYSMLFNIENNGYFAFCAR